VNEDNKLLVFIENKYGSRESSGQLPKYHKYLSENFESLKFRSVYIFLDVNYDEELNIKVDSNWIALNYEWLSQLLKSVLDRHVLTKQVRKTIRDYYIEISEDYEIGAYYADCLKTIRQLAIDNSLLVDILRTFNPEKYPKRLVANLLFDEVVDVDDTSKMLYDLYQKYGDILDEMQNYSDFDVIQELLKKEIRIQDDNFYKKRNFLYLTSPELAEFNKDGDSPPICVKYHKHKRLTNGTIKEDSIYIRIDLGRLPDKNVVEVLKVAESLSKPGQKYNKRY